MTRRVVVLFLLFWNSICMAQAPPAPASALPAPQISDHARRLHMDAIVVDTHIDTTQNLLRKDWDFTQRHSPPTADQGRRESGNGHIDLPRMRQGGLDAAFFSIFIPGTVTGPAGAKRALEQIDAVRRLAETHPHDMNLATTAAEVRDAARQGKIAILMGMEGGHMIDESLPLLRDYARLGVRYLTLSHTVNTTWSDSSTDKPAHNGLTDFGKDVVRELNRLGVMVDISHTADKTFWDALEVSRAPLIASHSSCRAISGHPRNMTDEMIKALAAKGGVIQINYLDQYLDDALYRASEKVRPEMEALRADLEKRFPGAENQDRRRQEMTAARAKLPPMPKVSWEKIVEHIDHAVKLVGAEHVGLGSDFDGATMPQGMDDVTMLPKITDALLKKGYSEKDIRAILGGNTLRLMEDVEKAAIHLNATTPSPAAAP